MPAKGVGVTRAGALLLAAGLLAGCACSVTAAGGEAMELQGSAIYRERMLLPPDARFSARLLAREGGATLAEQLLPEAGQIPIDFTLSLPDGAPASARLELEIAAEGRPLFGLEEEVDTAAWARSGRREFVLRSR